MPEMYECNKYLNITEVPLKNKETNATTIYINDGGFYQSENENLKALLNGTLLNELKTNINNELGTLGNLNSILEINSIEKYNALFDGETVFKFVYFKNRLNIGIPLYEDEGRRTEKNKADIVIPANSVGFCFHVSDTLYFMLTDGAKQIVIKDARKNKSGEKSFGEYLHPVAI